MTVKKTETGRTEAQDSLLRMEDQVHKNKVGYAEAQADLAGLLNRVTRNEEIVVISRRGHPPVALIAAAELRILLEEVYLLHSPNNARRLFDAMDEADRGEGLMMTVEELAEKFGLTEALTTKRLREKQ